MKTPACRIVGRVQATIRVQGIRRSGMRTLTFSQAMVGAKEPIPRVSKKFTTAPTAVASQPSFRTPWAIALRTIATA